MKLFNSKIALTTMLLSAIGLWSCSDDVQSPAETDIPEGVPAGIHADFTRSFPDATDVAWSVSNGYAVASFVSSVAHTDPSHISSVWYELKDNQKKMHNAPVAFQDLPSAVTSAFYASEYSTLTPSDPAYVLTRYHNGDVDYIYVIKAKGALEGTAATVAKLYYTGEGILIKLSSEILYDNSWFNDEDANEFKDWLPQNPSDLVKAYIDSRYPGARYLYIHEGENFTKVKILENHTVHLINFDADGNWISTETEIDKDNIPAEIIAGYQASEFAGWHINKVTEYSTASDGHYYMLSLENGKNKTELRIDADGALNQDPANPSGPENPAHNPDGNTYLAKADIPDFILAKYPGASIVKYDYDDDDAEVEILYNDYKIKLEFELHPQGYKWSQSEWNFNIKDTASLPSAILDSLSGSYGSCQLQYMIYHEDADSAAYYEIGLRSSQNKKTIKLQMDQNGNVIAEYRQH